KIRTDFTSMDEGQRADYMAAMSELVNDIYNFAELDKDDKQIAGMVYDATLLSKSALLSFSRSLGSTVRATGDPSLIALLEEFNAKRREYVRLEQQGDFASASDVRKEAGEIERRLQQSVAGCDPGSFMTTAWQDVKNGLGKNDAAVEFYTFTDNLYGAPEVRERIVALAANKNPHVFPLRYKAGEVSVTAPGQLRMLYLALWLPLEKEKFLKPGGTVYFAPSGRWNGLPLEYLPAGKDEEMNRRYRMVRVSTTRNKPDSSKPSLENTILFGGLDYNLDIDEMAAIRDEIAETGLRGPLDSGLWNFLPGTETEVENIATILSERQDGCETVAGADGIEEKFKSLSGGKHGVIHIATHGYYFAPENEAGLRSESVKMDEAMDNSGLVFSGANQFMAGAKSDDERLDDGLLTAREIALMDLSSTDLVVMSACETGTGKATSEGVLGLQRGFKLAGVNTLIMSLWKVNDEATAAMMESFYRYLAEGMDKRDAFYRARTDLRKGTFHGSDGFSVAGTDPLIGDAFVILD
nr:CHAT domain-containing protein [Duncaniella sp.]